jgi:hypothetical protein
MRPAPGEWDDLRLAARAADRETAAEKLRPAFERRLNELGYSPLATAHAFSALTGPATVKEALDELAQNARSDRLRAIPLEFETVERQAGLPAGHSLRVTGVERDGYGIRIRYEVHPPLPTDAPAPRGEGRGDRGHGYANLGTSSGIAASGDRTTGSVTMPLPHPHASLLRVRLSWSLDPTSPWERPAQEVRIFV